ncbi:yjeF N-terminal domain-containing protein 3 isoform X2 [Delphinapterus leucas]|uniref:YjeF N-terminal domain-containing protein 3 isoform X2 n=1 Tax=Delphinapterus leucas TaxID=9749 RepID=A0A2Y9LXZ0_DELLE|nr:yjeF N-terminal domain-containing protein 3 isoform X2 [Delphinapterus leucas]
MHLKGCGGGGCLRAQITSAMSSAAGPDLAEAPEERCFLSTAEAAALERELLEDYRFGRQQLVEWCGHASAVAVTKVFPLPAHSRKQRTVLVVCGPEQNGAVGLVCARHLRVFCEKMDIPFLSYLPTEVQLINNAYRLAVDAVLGPGVEPGKAGGPCMRALATLKLLSIPLVSLDIPSGMSGGVGGMRIWRAWVEVPVPWLLVVPACLPTLSLSFPSMDGSCTLGEAEGHVHPSDGEYPGWCPCDPGSPPPYTQHSVPAAHPGPVTRGRRELTRQRPRSSWPRPQACWSH